MGNDRLEEMARGLEADPENKELRSQLYAERSRLQGSSVYLDLFRDRELWKSSSPALQDQAVEVIAPLLEDDFQWIENKLYHCRDESFRIPCFRHKKVDMVFHLLPGGGFSRGQSWQRAEDRIQIEVGPFLMARFPVLQVQWEEVAQEQDDFRDAHLPMHLVSWSDVHEWLVPLGKLGLPTEDQWEYAYRAGTQTEYFWGKDMDDSYCWHSEHPDLARVHDALSPDIHHRDKKWNAFGLVDMAGNIWEMCEDPFYGLLDLNQYDNKVMKGGAWKNPPRTCMADYRGLVNAFERYNNIGFRLAYPLDEIFATTKIKETKA